MRTKPYQREIGDESVHSAWVGSEININNTQGKYVKVSTKVEKLFTYCAF